MSYLKRGKDADNWFKRALRGKAEQGKGQSTLEYALISAAFMAVVLGVGAISDLFSGGIVVSHVIDAASHGLESPFSGVIDAFSY